MGYNGRIPKIMNSKTHKSGAFVLRVLDFAQKMLELSA